MGKYWKKTLTPDTQLTFTCFLKKHFLASWLLYYVPEWYIYIYIYIYICVCVEISKKKEERGKKQKAKKQEEVRSKSKILLLSPCFWWGSNLLLMCSQTFQEVEKSHKQEKAKILLCNLAYGWCQTHPYKTRTKRIVQFKNWSHISYERKQEN